MARAGRAGARLRQLRAVGVAGAGAGLGTADPARLSDDDADRGDRRVRPGRLLGGGAAGPAARRAGPPPARRPGAALGATGRGWAASTPPTRSGWRCTWPAGTACRPDRRWPAGCWRALPDTHALWEAGRIDTAKARAIDDATWCCPTSWPAPCRRGCCPGRRSRPWPSSRRRWPGRSSPSTPTGAEQRHRRPAGTGGWWSPRSRTGWARCGRCSPPPTPPGPSPG